MWRLIRMRTRSGSPKSACRARGVAGNLDAREFVRGSARFAWRIPHRRGQYFASTGPLEIEFVVEADAQDVVGDVRNDRCCQEGSAGGHDRRDEGPRHGAEIDIEVFDSWRSSFR